MSFIKINIGKQEFFINENYFLYIDLKNRLINTVLEDTIYKMEYTPIIKKTDKIYYIKYKAYVNLNKILKILYDNNKIVITFDFDNENDDVYYSYYELEIVYKTNKNCKNAYRKLKAKLQEYSTSKKDCNILKNIENMLLLLPPIWVTGGPEYLKIEREFKDKLREFEHLKN